MPRKKVSNRERLLTHPIRTRLTRKNYNRLEEIARNSNCSSVGEVARKILSRQRIVLFHRDISMNGPMEELAMIRKELKSIGININQQTRYFNASESDAERTFYALKTAELYQKIDGKVDRLLKIVSKLAEKWLPR